MIAKDKLAVVLPCLEDYLKTSTYLDDSGVDEAFEKATQSLQVF